MRSRELERKWEGSEQETHNSSGTEAHIGNGIGKADPDMSPARGRIPPAKEGDDVPILQDPVHRAAREQMVLLAEEFLDELLTGFALAILEFSKRMRAESGMGPRPDPDEKPRKAPQKPPQADPRLKDDDGRGTYDPGAANPKKPGSAWRTAKVQQKAAQPEPPPPPDRTVEQILENAGRYRRVVEDAIAAADGGQKEEDVPYLTPSGYRTKWFEAFRARKREG